MARGCEKIVKGEPDDRRQARELIPTCNCSREIKKARLLCAIFKRLWIAEVSGALRNVAEVILKPERFS